MKKAHIILLRNIICLVPVMILSFMLAGCDKVPDNGKLDGMWQVMEVTVDGNVTNTKADKLYWCVRSNLIQFTDNILENIKFARFKRNGDKLVLRDFAFASANETEADNNEWISIDDEPLMNMYGVWAVADETQPGRITQTYNIDKLTNDVMILSSVDGRTHIVFRKF